jgi:hypothetical protein
MAFVSMSVILGGCSSTILVRLDEPLNNDRVFNYAQVNSKVDSTPGTIFCLDGSSYQVSHTHVGKDSTLFIEMTSGLTHSIATRDIVAIQRKDYGAGTLTGALLGSLTGLTGGIALLAFDKGGVLELFGMIGGAAILGGLIGSFEGSVQEFRFPTDQPNRPAASHSTKAGAP